MIDLLIMHASELVTCRAGPKGAVGRDLERLNIVTDGAVAIDRGRIVAVDPTRVLRRAYRARRVIDARGRLVSPGLIDPHSHLVYAGSRHHEYESLITGKTTPGRRLGSGIRYTVGMTRRAPVAALRAQARADLDVMLVHGTTTVEAKTGYGLDRSTELRMLRILKSLQHPVEVVATYLGAHVLPAEYRNRRSAYVALVISMLRDARQYAEYCDVCCDPVGFTVEECFRIGREALTLGFRLKVHADQTGPAKGAELAARCGATSADHLDYISARGIRAMARRGTVGVLLPGVTYHMMEMTPMVEGGRLRRASKPFMPLAVRRMIEGGMRLALSADYNPGTSPTQSMQVVMQLAARLYRLSYGEIWLMSTINAAHALDRGRDRGSLEAGKRADLVLWRVPEHGMVINRFGVNLVHTVVKDGRVVVEGGVLSYASRTSSSVPPR